MTLIMNSEIKTVVPVQFFNEKELSVLSKISAIDKFMLDDSRDWFYFSEIAIENAYKAMRKGIELLVLDQDIKDALKQLMAQNNNEFTDLSILIVIFPLLARSEESLPLVQSCLSHLITNKLASNPDISFCVLKPNTLDSELDTYKLLPHMKALTELIYEINEDLQKSLLIVS